MKKLITIDAIICALMGAIGYGVGYMIPSMHNCSIIICYISCFALGGIVDYIVDRIIYNKTVQNNQRLKRRIFAGMIAVYIAAFIAVKKMLGLSLLSDTGWGISWLALTSILWFLLAYCIRYKKRRKLAQKYGTGEGGFVIDEKVIEHLRSMTGENKTHSDYAGSDPVARAVSGSYIGKKGRDVVSFLGIPYARAERWKRAVQVEDSEEYFEAFYFGSPEIQPGSSHNVIAGFDQDEDCLNLNIWTSKLEAESQKPVFVFFHGGDGRYGGSINPAYHLENIAKAIPRAVFVSFNYRLGLFGVVDFSSSQLPDRDEYKDSTALSLLDQVEALRWIKKNISAFGGDPDNITVAGDSAGGTSICLLAAAREAKGLFKRALIMCASTNDAPMDNKWASALGEKLIEEFDAKSVADLKKVTPGQLREFSERHYDLMELPPRNGSFIPRDVWGEYLGGAASDIDFIFGIAADDFSGWQAMLVGDVYLDEMVEGYLENFRAHIAKEKLDELEELLGRYKQMGLGDREAKMAMLSDSHFKASPLRDCGILAKGGSDVRVFYWDVKGDVEKLTANDISMVTALLGNMDIAEQMGYIHQKHITKIMQALLAKFIEGRSPWLYNNEITGVSKIDWKKYDTDKEYVLHIQSDEIKVKKYPFSDNVRELEKLVFEK